MLFVPGDKCQVSINDLVSVCNEYKPSHVDLVFSCVVIWKSCLLHSCAAAFLVLIIYLSSSSSIVIMWSFDTFTATDELSHQLICCDVHHWQVYLSVSSCNVTVRQCSSRPPAGATVGLFDWCSALEENGLTVNVLSHLPEIFEYG